MLDVQVTSTICATVDPVSNSAVWINRKTNAAHVARYRDNGGEHVNFNRPVPQLVRKLVEDRTGRRIRIGCR